MRIDNTMQNIKAIILAAGKGTRMKSELPKVLHTVLGKPMVEYSIEAAKQAGAQKICLVVGHKAELVKQTVKDSVEYVEQKEQLGTGHAVKCAREFVGSEGEVLVLCGDTPLITGTTLAALVEEHRSNQNAITVLSTVVEDSTGYGRIIRNEQGEFIKIVEQKDANVEELACKEINSGMYLFDCAILQEYLDQIDNNNAQGEYYLPDVLKLVKQDAVGRVDAMITKDVNEIRGVNSPEQLKEAEEIMKERFA